MAIKKSQLSLCGTCGKPIEGAVHTVPTKTGKAMTFHTDAKGCATAKDVKEPRKSNSMEEDIIRRFN